MTVDAYAHCGQDKYLPVSVLDAVMSASQVSSAVLCQHLGQFDNSYIAGVVRGRPERFAGIALIDHNGASWAHELATIGSQKFRGVRITAAAMDENPSLAQAVAAAGLIPVVYAADGIEALLPAVAELAGIHPRTPVVVSHLGNPRVEGNRLSKGEEILSLATYPNVCVALSGLSMFCPYPYAPLDGLIRRVVEAFGPGRLMWGSNYPVCGEAAADYGRDLGLLLSRGRWGLNPAAAKEIADTTARRLWFG
jgi:predicted TIM-barrel fold metal-dependent hydrolase